ncbi:MAG: hypothetical protein ACK4IK_02190 [Bacteroidia bacterium]
MKRFLLLLLTAFVIISCRKYKEDPVTVIVKKPESRILGSWACESIYINGNDETYWLKDSVGIWEFQFRENVGFSHVLFMQSIKSSNPFFGYTFIDKHKKLVLQGDYSILKQEGRYGKLWFFAETIWEIKALNKKNLKIKYTSSLNNQTYEISFKRLG